MTVVLVVPTIREACIARFLAAWQPYPWDHAVVVEDNPEPTFKLDGIDAHYSWQDIEGDFPGEDIFSRRDSAIKTYGFYKAVKEFGATHVLTLDDDCMPSGHESKDKFVRKHLQALQPKQWTSSWPGLRVRGLPYMDWGDAEAEVLVNMGLWTEVPDLDAIGMLSEPPIPPLPPADYSRLMHPEQYFPMCGMNLFFSVKALPLMYFPKMGEGSPYARFDDIWCGLIAQHILKQFNTVMTVGAPFIRHEKASDALVNLKKEAPGIAAHELFWWFVRSIKFPPTLERTIPAYLLHLAEQFQRLEGSVAAELPHAPSHLSAGVIRQSDAELAEYVKQYGNNLAVWHAHVTQLPLVQS